MLKANCVALNETNLYQLFLDNYCTAILTLDPKVVSISEVLLGQSRPLLCDLAHRLGTIRGQNLELIGIMSQHKQPKENHFHTYSFKH